jgi:CheY-like chemotaxis protein
MAAALGPCVAEPAVEARCVDPYSPRSRWSGPESSRLAPIRTSNVLVLLGVPAGRNLPCRRGSHLSRDSLTRQPGVTRIRQIGAHPSGLTGSKRDGGRRNHPKPPTMRIVLAEDELLLSEGMASLLERSGFMLVGQAGDAVQLSRWAATPPPDLVVVDIRMPPTRTREGLETAGKSASSPPTSAFWSPRRFPSVRASYVQLRGTASSHRRSGTAPWIKIARSVQDAHSG